MDILILAGTFPSTLLCEMVLFPLRTFSYVITFSFFLNQEVCSNRTAFLCTKQEPWTHGPNPTPSPWALPLGMLSHRVGCPISPKGTPNEGVEENSQNSLQTEIRPWCVRFGAEELETPWNSCTEPWALPCWHTFRTLWIPSNAPVAKGTQIPKATL